MSAFCDMPYTTDYAKSARSHCRWCRDKIEKGVVRLAAMVQSKHHEGRDACWYHVKCFFAKYRYVSVNNISNISALELPDQELVRNYAAGKIRNSAKEAPQKSGINGLVNSGDFHIAYAKSSISHCVSCDGRIAKGEVRVSQMDYTSERALVIPSGKIDRWHHLDCFINNREKLEFYGNAKKLPGFFSLKPSDQDDILARLPISDGFHVEYAQSNLSRCVACNDQIVKDEVRISLIDHTSEKAMLVPSGKIHRWHHVECFVKNREKLGFFKGADLLPGISYLKPSDRQNLMTRLPPSDPPQNDIVQVNVADEITPSLVECNPALKDQEELMASLKDTLNTNLRDKDQLSQLLKHNNQEIPIGIDRMIERVADIMTFGALQPCSVCKGQFVYKNYFGYQCSGYINLQTKCGNIVKDPVRLPFEIPQDLKDNPVLQNYTYVSRKRIIPIRPKPTETEEPPNKLPKIDRLPLMNLKFLISDGILNKALRIHLNNQIDRYGGKVMDKNSNQLTAIISTPDEVRKMTRRMMYAKQHGIPVISSGFANSITEVNFNFTDLVKKFLICDWSFANGSTASATTTTDNTSSQTRALQPLHLNQACN